MTQSVKIKENIKLLVKKEPEVAESYNLLVVRYWEVFNGADDLSDAPLCVPAESITRLFRDLVREGEIVLPEKVYEKRKARQAAMKEHFTKLQTIPRFIERTASNG